MRRLSLICLSLGFAGTALAAPGPEVAAIAAHYRAWLPLHPLDATDLGLHDAKLDGVLPELGAAADRAILAQLAASVGKLDAAARAPGCSEPCRTELELVRFFIEEERFDISEIHGYERYADSALDVASAAVFPLIKRDFAPLSVRAELAIARLGAMPKLFGQALAILRKSDRLVKSSIALAQESVPESARFLENDVPAAFDGLPDAALKARAHAAGKRAADALRAYGKALDGEISARARPEFALGEATFIAFIQKHEMISEPLPQLLARGRAELARLQLAFRDVAHRIDPKKDPRVLKVELGRDHVVPGALLGEVRARLAALRAFVVKQDLVGVPSEILPKVEETPPFLRATTQASMDTPGPFEAKATEAYYHITLPDPSWTKERVEDYLGGAFNRPLIDVVSIHEALPGHYVQFLWRAGYKSQARRMQSNGAYSEGWAHYCEEMMLDAGWGQGGTQLETDKLRLAQLSDALLRAARYVVAIRMHTADMTMDEARRFFEEEGYQSHEVAIIEAKRGTEDPAYFHYTWGKLELKKLRDELRQKWGKSFSLRRFHDAVLAEGPIPLPMLRRALLQLPN